LIAGRKFRQKPIWEIEPTTYKKMAQFFIAGDFVELQIELKLSEPLRARLASMSGDPFRRFRLLWASPSLLSS
jgi:hypothetical protein